MLARLAPLALVMMAGCEPGGSGTNTPSAIAPQALVRAVVESPGDGSDILEVLDQFESAENSRRGSAGLAISGSTLEELARAPVQSRLVGSWRPVPTPEQEADIRVLARHACSGAVDPTIAIQRAVSGCTLRFDANGAWSSAWPVDHPAAMQWKTTKNGERGEQIWLSESQFGPERTVSCEFASPGELIVRDGLAWFTRFERVN